MGQLALIEHVTMRKPLGFTEKFPSATEKSAKETLITRIQNLTMRSPSLPWLPLQRNPPVLIS